jgi:hypothetical protein
MAPLPLHGVFFMGRRERQPTDIHHKHPRSQGGGNEPDNLVKVNRKDHQAWHRLFHNFGPATIAAIINTTWIPLEFKMVALPASGALAVWQLINWMTAYSHAKHNENKDGDGI